MVEKIQRGVHFLHLYCQKCAFLASGSVCTSMSHAGCWSFGCRAEGLALQTILSQKALVCFHLPSFHLICYPVWQSLPPANLGSVPPLLLSVLPGLASSLSSSGCLICIPFSMPSPSCLPPWLALPIPGTASVQHSVHSTFLFQASRCSCRKSHSCADWRCYGFMGLCLAGSSICCWSPFSSSLQTSYTSFHT